MSQWLYHPQRDGIIITKNATEQAMENPEAVT